jgi:hypothetical protein
MLIFIVFIALFLTLFVTVAALNIRDKGILELKAAGQSFLLMEAV